MKWIKKKWNEFFGTRREIKRSNNEYGLAGEYSIELSGLNRPVVSGISFY
jgi:hypothetical protein